MISVTLGWRLLLLRIGDLRLFDCKRIFNFFIGEPEDVLRPDTTEVRFHLDAPRTGIDTEHRGAFMVSGWAFDLSRFKALAVRVVVGNEALKTHVVDRPDVAKKFSLEPKLPASIGFSLLISPGDGRLRFAIELLHPRGLWITCQRGWVIATAGLAQRPEEGPVERLTRALPIALRSRIRDRFRSTRRGIPTRLAESCHFHLDTPKTDGLNIVRGDFLASGWVFDAKAASPMPVRVRVGDREFAAEARQREDVQRVFKHVASMPPHTGFACALNLPLGIHLVRIEVRRPDGVWVQMRRSRVLRLPGAGVVGEDVKQSQLSFRAYRELEETYRKRELPEIRQHVTVMLRKPRFSVIVSGAAARDVENSIRSVQQQVYEHFTIHLLASAAKNVTAFGPGRSPGTKTGHCLQPTMIS